MRFVSLLVMISASAITAEAHLGNENHTEVRVFSDRMRVVIRTSIPFAWNLLGTQAPAMADDAGQAIARPMLVAVAPNLIKVTANGRPLVPALADCVFEVGDDVAFILNFNRPTEWPVVVEATFFDRFTSLDTGTIRIFDHTASRFSRDLKPVAERTIDQRTPSISFDLGNAAGRVSPAPEPAPPATTTPPSPPPSRNPVIALGILLAATGGVGYLAWRRWRSAA